MLDVIHVFFEEDMIPTWEQSAESKDTIRKSIYSNLYGTEYKYSISAGRSATFDTFSGDYDDDIGYDAPPGTVKPFIPATPVEELDSILGGPMG